MREKYSKNTSFTILSLFLGSTIFSVMIAGAFILQNHATPEKPLSVTPTTRSLPTPIMISVGGNVPSVIIEAPPTRLPQTPQPTPFAGQISIVEIEDMGGANETIVLANNGTLVDLTGYSLTDTEGHTYRYEQILFSNAKVRLHSGTGEDTPLDRYWGLNDPIWEAGDLITLRAQTRVIDTYLVGEAGVEVMLDESPVAVVGIRDQGGPKEHLRIRNTGNTISLTGYTLSDNEGHDYIFKEQFLFSGAELLLFTQDGQDTAIKRHWGLSAPIWEHGETVTLKDAQGNLVDKMTVGEAR